LLYKNPPSQQVSYSSVIVQVTDTGWAVQGYNGLENYFEILASRVNGKTQTLSAGGSTEQVPVEYTNSVVRVPYGFVFTNRSAVCDFLLSYGKLLTDRGFVFDRSVYNFKYRLSLNDARRQHNLTSMLLNSVVRSLLPLTPSCWL